MLPLDDHVHFGLPQGMAAARAEFAKMPMGLFAHQFLLSNAYRFPEENANDINQQVSVLAAEQPKRFTGFCGVNLKWKEALSITRACLALPGMKGIKLHSYSTKAYLSGPNGDQYVQKVEEILSSVQDLKPLVMWHPEPDWVSTQYPPGEREWLKIRRIVEHHPDVTFIIAHSGDEGFLDNWDQTSRQQGHAPRNVYLDLSCRFQPIGNGPALAVTYLLPDYFLERWRRFGLERVLFGSDYPLHPPENLLKAIMTETSLSAKEKNLILFENEERFLREHNIEFDVPLRGEHGSGGMTADERLARSLDLARKRIGSLDDWLAAVRQGAR